MILFFHYHTLPYLLNFFVHENKYIDNKAACCITFVSQIRKHYILTDHTKTLKTNHTTIVLENMNFIYEYSATNTT